MFPASRLAAAGILAWSAAASAQDLKVVAELPMADAAAAGSVTVRRLAPGGPLFVLAFTNRAVDAWRAGAVEEARVTPLDGGTRGAGSPVLEDFDGDGLTDLAFVATNEIGFLRGDGAGGFVPAAKVATSEQQYQLVAGDFDGDGRPDLASVQANQNPYPVVSVFRGTGAFRFDAPVRTTIQACCGVQGIAAGDLDGDGRADVVVSAAQGSVTVWLGNGDGTLRQSPTTVPGPYPARAILADVDGDGRPDIVYFATARFPPFNVYVYRNDGGGLFHQLARFGTSPSSRGPVVVDFDGSGRLSVVFNERDAAGDFLSVQTYAAGAFFSRRLALPLSPDIRLDRGYAAADWNGDGGAEILGPSERGIEVFGLAGARVDLAVVPVVLSTTGLNGSRFDSDLLLTNSGSSPAHVTLRYTAAAGGGTGAAERDLAPGRQLFAESAVGFLRDAGLAIATEGNVIGTLRIETTGASSPRAVSASVRTTSPGGAGVAYGGVPNLDLLRGPSIVPWLVETPKDRSNLALVNGGAPSDGPVTLRVEVHAGDAAVTPVVLPDVVLAPGEFRQVGRVLVSAGLSAPTGWARILRVAGSAPYLAWAAVNDAGSADGSFVPAAPERSAVYGTWVVPSAAQTSRYATELVATNPGSEPLPLEITVVSTGTVLSETIAPGATFHVPDFFAELRRRGLAGAPAQAAEFVSPLYLKSGTPGMPLHAGIRVSSSPAAGRSYGVFEAATFEVALHAHSAVVSDLRQDGRTRTNLGVLNIGSGAGFRVEVFDGASGALAGSTILHLENNVFTQINAILRELAPGTTRGWARITPTSPYSVGSAWPFCAYAVVNDGAEPGKGTGDGSFVPAIAE